MSEQERKYSYFSDGDSVYCGECVKEEGRESRCFPHDTKFGHHDEMKCETCGKSLEAKGYTLDSDGHASDTETGKPFTDPYEHITWSVGNGDDFVCFDYAILPNGEVALHATLNSETGSFIMTYEYSIVEAAEAVETAQGMVDSAFGWCVDNELRYNRRDSERSGKRFVRSVKDDTTKLIKANKG